MRGGLREKGVGRREKDGKSTREVKIKLLCRRETRFAPRRDEWDKGRDMR